MSSTTYWLKITYQIINSNQQDDRSYAILSVRAAAIYHNLISAFSGNHQVFSPAEQPILLDHCLLCTFSV
jgi:hypothetical protein